MARGRDVQCAQAARRVQGSPGRRACVVRRTRRPDSDEVVGGPPARSPRHRGAEETPRLSAGQVSIVASKESRRRQRQALADVRAASVPRACTVADFPGVGATAAATVAGWRASRESRSRAASTTSSRAATNGERSTATTTTAQASSSSSARRSRGTGGSCSDYVLMTNHYHLLIRRTSRTSPPACTTSRPSPPSGSTAATDASVTSTKADTRRDSSKTTNACSPRSATSSATRRARLCARPDQWRWSSQRSDPRSRPHPDSSRPAVLARFHHDRQKAADQPQRSRTPRRHPPPDPDQPRHPSYHDQPTTDQLAAARDAGHTITAIAHHLNQHKSTISRRLKHATTET